MRAPTSSLGSAHARDVAYTASHGEEQQKQQRIRRGPSRLTAPTELEEADTVEARSLQCASR